MERRVLLEGEEEGGYIIKEYFINGQSIKKRKRVIKKKAIMTKSLTPEQKEEIDNAFLIFDKDHSGSIDVLELTDAMKALGIYLKRSEA